ncbi:hypothetical protein N7532_003900 [Penicillium argentinense]|uniref:Uncharacterized protein n=1 Tax=Penicillium argentinense TaxID=1131581 RepID=A0A9W9FN97_9EURO|nr:uncharacterized protein N7532_003900 [Penicillium argentinense]KAJ5103371.1 hypothetical protein N7532_003900 [Penicillium argentinense]
MDYLRARDKQHLDLANPSRLPLASLSLAMPYKVSRACLVWSNPIKERHRGAGQPFDVME